MDKTNCYFAKEPPEFELRGDHVVATPSHGQYEVVLAPQTLQKLVARANRVLDEWHEGRRGVVIPMRAKG